MIDIDNIEILKNSICPINEASIDNHNGNVICMTDSLLDVVNFDRVKDAYIESLGVSKIPKSSDAFYVSKNKMYLIEFKNGRMDAKKIFDVRRKIFDSLLILTDILQIGISCTRKDLSYILVYNETRNPVNEKENELQISPSRVKIADYFLHQGKSKFIRFNLEEFERMYFKDMFTVTVSEFEEHFLKVWTEN